jgi:selenoprotein W-related protein
MKNITHWLPQVITIFTYFWFSNFRSVLVSSFVTTPRRYTHYATPSTLIGNNSLPRVFSASTPATVTTLKSKNTDAELSKDDGGPSVNLSIEYCTGCRWMFRSAWLAQELLTTFANELGSVTLIPSKPPSPGGTFLIKLDHHIVWDRRVEGSFPESKQLKQRVRDLIAPKKDLGHSDVDSSKSKLKASPSDSKSNSDPNSDGYCEECEEESKQTVNKSPVVTEEVDSGDADNHANTDPGVGDAKGSTNEINIIYCTGCKWMMKAAYYAQELLTTFQDELTTVTLTPSRPPEAEGGRFVSNFDIFSLSSSSFFLSTYSYCSLCSPHSLC